MKIGVVGGGISGLSVAHLLEKNHDIEILESSRYVGGIARIADVGGFPYHLVGGHCFNSKNKDIRDFVFSVLPVSEWNLIRRHANILLFGEFIKYPIEYSVRQLYSIDKDLALRCVEDYITSSPASENINLEEWFRCTFGDALADLYFIPYNKKIWGIEPKYMNSAWVKDKLPIPDRKSFLTSLFSEADDNMVHSFFYYPKDVINDNLISRLSEGKKIITEYDVKDIKKLGDKFIINDERLYDKLIVTAPLDVAVGMFSEVPDEIQLASSLLKYNKISNVLWETDGVDATWTYLPENSTIFHRHIHIGNFINPRKNLTITEALGDVPYDVMISEGAKFKYLRRPLSYNVSNHAYVLQDGNKEAASSLVKKFIEEQGVFLCGRFAEWDYYNMDICIKSAMNVAKCINEFLPAQKS